VRIECAKYLLVHIHSTACSFASCLEATRDLVAKLIQVLSGRRPDTIFRPGVVGNDIRRLPAVLYDAGNSQGRLQLLRSVEMPTYAVTSASNAFFPCQDASPACEARPPTSAITLCDARLRVKAEGPQALIGSESPRVNHHARIRPSLIFPPPLSSAGVPRSLTIPVPDACVDLSAS
jgi:hypothetical protein